MFAVRRLALAAFLLVGLAPPVAAELPPLIIPGHSLRQRPAQQPAACPATASTSPTWLPTRRTCLQVWLRTIGKRGRPQVTADKKRGIRSYFWTYDGGHLLYLQDNDGDENSTSTRSTSRPTQVRDLTPFQGVRAELVGRDVDSFPHEMLVGMNLKDKRSCSTCTASTSATAPSNWTRRTPATWSAGWPTPSSRCARPARPRRRRRLRSAGPRRPPTRSGKRCRHWGPDERRRGARFFTDGRQDALPRWPTTTPTPRGLRQARPGHRQGNGARRGPAVRCGQRAGPPDPAARFRRSAFNRDKVHVEGAGPDRRRGFRGPGASATAASSASSAATWPTRPGWSPTSTDDSPVVLLPLRPRQPRAARALQPPAEAGKLQAGADEADRVSSRATV